VSHFAGHVLVADMDEPRTSTSTPEPWRTLVASATNRCTKIHAQYTTNIAVCIQATAAGETPSPSLHCAIKATISSAVEP
jgi:hypothetical protein